MAPKAKQRRQETTQHLCRICNIWIADNKLQRDQHESGAKHIANRQKLLRQIAEKNEKARAEARKEGRSTEGGSRAVQELMEIALQATQGKILEPEKTDIDKSDVEQSDQQVDEKGYPTAANSLFEWIAVADENDGDTNGQEEEEEEEGRLEQSAQEAELHHVITQQVAGVKRTLGREPVVSSVKEEDKEDAQERTDALSSFKKRPPAAGRKRRRKR
ncbi:hypothetical protein BWQ96_07952 [Gracilariopsis chorda]|uniref:U1-type domain-containing protein n=1 Tax=Gracilariopsis chorda TaxID=448386 RepID=A0A2V3IJR3_9FLOR|nr:hypothetical protein BWQ96_07952 [Gracilariopsis chorda]|eukprot:PXF42317.1 hypothetical protein BWQ96_07952 [Gracilariopsis chorda]